MAIHVCGTLARHMAEWMKETSRYANRKTFSGAAERCLREAAGLHSENMQTSCLRRRSTTEEEDGQSLLEFWLLGAFLNQTRDPQRNVPDFADGARVGDGIKCRACCLSTETQVETERTRASRGPLLV